MSQAASWDPGIPVLTEVLDDSVIAAPAPALAPAAASYAPAHTAPAVWRTGAALTARTPAATPAIGAVDVEVEMDDLPAQGGGVALSHPATLPPEVRTHASYAHAAAAPLPEPDWAALRNQLSEELSGQIVGQLLPVLEQRLDAAIAQALHEATGTLRAGLRAELAEAVAGTVGDAVAGVVEREVAGLQARTR